MNRSYQFKLVFLFAFLGLLNVGLWAQQSHTVEKGETFYGIAKKYGITAAVLLQANPQIGADMGIKAGEKINIPAKGTVLKTSPKPKTATAPPPSPVAPTTSPTPKPISSITNLNIHKVQKGESLYGIAQLNGVSVDQLRAYNNLQGNGIYEGQNLKIPSKDYIPADNSVKRPPVAVQKSTVSTQSPTLNSGTLAIKNENAIVKDSATAQKSNALSAVEQQKMAFIEIYNHYAADPVYKKKSSRGAAIGLDESNSAGSMFAFYSAAPIGTILRVKNMMNGEVVYVKCLGPLPETDAQNEVMIKLTFDAVKQLRVLDEKFLVQVDSYLR